MSGSVLLVEDNDLTRAALREPLVAEGIAVLEARDGASAREQVARGGLDLVLLDLLLRDTDALDLARELRLLGGARGVPFVAVSGFLSRASAAAMMASFEEVVTKPVEARRLLQVVRGYVACGAKLAPQPGLGRHALVVDDDPVQAKLTRIVLARAGFRVTIARSGEEALRAASAEPPDVILSDVLMPAMDGFRLCEQARSNPALARVPVVLVSASYVEPADQDLAGRVGASALVLKTPGLEGALGAVVASLERAPPAPAPRAPGAFDADYTERVLRQLDRQMAQSVGLAQRCSTQAAMLSVVSTLTEAWADGSDLGSTLGRMLRGALEIGGVSHGAVFVRRGPALELAAVCGFSPPDRSALEALAASAALAGLIAPDGPAELVLASPAGAVPAGRSAVLAPLVSAGQRHGVLLVASEGEQLDDEWKAFVRALGGQVGQAIALDAARAQLTFSEERYRALMRGARDGVFVLSPAGVILEASSGAEELIGVPRAELLGRDLRVFRQEDPEGVTELLERVLAGGLGRAADVVVRGRGGRRRVVDVSGQAVEVGAERVLLVVTHDVTERHQAEREMRLLHAVALGTARSESLEDTLRVVLREACRATGWPFGSAWVPRPGGEALDCVCAWAGTPEERAALEGAIRTRSLGRGEGSPGRAWASGGPALSALPAAGVPAFWREAVGHFGLGAGVSVPVLADGEVVAVIALHSGEVMGPEGHVVALVSALASQVGAVVRRRMSEEALRLKEAELRQAQKMEAVGLLAGGIAHDFNNILSVILGDCAFALDALGASHPATRDVEEIRVCAEKAAGLTRQVLAFSRRQVLEPRVLDLNASVREVEALLERVLGADVELALALEPALWPVKADPGQLEQVLLNLSVNARDAMPGGGRLALLTRNEEAAPGPDGHPRSVLLEVSDSGEGMDPATAARVFEPFFTTKAPGKGTGLGLAMVHGFVAQSGGTIRLRTERGVGTTFSIRFPPAEQAPVRAEPEQDARAFDGTETVLVLDDDALLRSVAVKALEARGYVVLAAGSAREALELARGHAGELHLVLSDVIIPGQSGPQVCARLRSGRPGLKVLFMSGHAEHAALRDALEGGARFLQKPFTPQALAAAVRAALDA